MTRREKLEEQYEDAYFALLMDAVAEKEGARLEELNDQLNRDLSAVTASAADTNEQDELVTFILEYDKSCEVYELSDGTTVVFGVIPAASTYAGYDIEKATARPTATHTYTCSANLGDECRGAIENIDEENSMTATMEYDATSAPEDNVSSTRTIVPGDRLVMVAKSTSGNGLAGIMTATITAEKASSVIYSYSVDQHW